MTDHDDEREVSRRYRELPREEPPAHLDAAIRAQARRLGGTRPAPLVPPTGRRSWHYPAAAAAVLVLAVAVTWHVEREQADPAEVVATSPSEPAAQPEAPAQPEAKARLEAQAGGEARSAAPAMKPEAAVKPEPARPLRREAPPAEAPATGAPPPVSSEAQEAPRARAKERSAEAARDMAPMMSQRSAPAAVAGAAARPETPETWLERIAKLRREGRHEEADEALAEFRKRYPDFRIAPEMLERIEKK